MPDRAVAHLVEIVDAIARIRAYTQGMDRAAFLTDLKTQDAAALQLAIIGESARGIVEVGGSEAPEIPWSLVISLRNRIVHGYRSIDHTTIWDIIERHLPDLDLAARRMLLTRGETPDPTDPP